MKPKMRFEAQGHFNWETAEKLGIPAALALNIIELFMASNKKEEKNEFFIEDKWWVAITGPAFKKALRIYGRTAIKRSIKSLDIAGLILIRRFDQSEGDQTNWFTLHPQAEANLANYTMPYANWTDETDRVGKGHGVTVSKSDMVPCRKVTPTVSESDPDRVGKRPLYKGVKSNIRVVKSNIRTPPPSEVLSLEGNWDDNDPLAKVFTNLTKLAICASDFTAIEYDAWLSTLMKQESLTIQELIKTSDQWQEYHNGMSKKPKSPKASFRTWVNNYLERREKNKPKANEPRPGDIDYDYQSGW